MTLLLLAWGLIAQMFERSSILVYRITLSHNIFRRQGRSGRDGKPSLAVVLPSKSATQGADISMKEYELNQKTCRRDFLFSDVDNYSHEDCGKCLCCDVCAKSCSCGSRVDKHSSFVIIKYEGI